MTNEVINEEIAKACGRVRRPDGAWYAEGSTVGSGGIPNYYKDLNAMHEAEKSLIAGQRDMEYREALEPLCGQYAIIYHATARQRAEAFLRTLGLWKEEA